MMNTYNLITWKNLSVGLLLILATGLSAWSFLNPQAHRIVKPDDPREADSYMEDVVATVYTKEGAMKLKLISPKLVHYPDNNTTEINTPNIAAYKDSQLPWYINADFAKATHGIEQIDFSSHVRIQHAQEPSTPATVMKTEMLTIYSEKQIASTDKPVTFIQPDTVIHAVGMLANLNDGTVNLMSNTQGEYVPHDL